MTEEAAKNIALGAGAIVLFLAIITYAAASWGYAWKVLWAWFLNPLFGFSITFRQGVGLWVTSTLVTKKAKPKEKNKRELWTWVLLGPWITLAIGWGVRVVLW